MGRGRRGCARLRPRSLSLAALDSSPDVGEPNSKKERPGGPRILFVPAGGTEGTGGFGNPPLRGWLGDFSIIDIGEGSKPSRFLIRAERRNIFWGRGEYCCGWRRRSHLIPALPRPGGEGEHAGEGEAREEGLRTTMASTPQSPAGDSSPYEGELKRTRLRLAARSNVRRGRKPFLGGRLPSVASRQLISALRAALRAVALRNAPAGAALREGSLGVCVRGGKIRKRTLGASAVWCVGLFYFSALEVVAFVAGVADGEAFFGENAVGDDGAEEVRFIH